ncbi:hypothetical protein D3D02_18300 [Halobellus sp. Atlit-38R]|nr:hypothetical protein [Halobellus sp. Atlit-38R]RLM83350.1 hypothetical protein D3D02_18300 [Halobellus sp. Atlit-38R]
MVLLVYFALPFVVFLGRTGSVPVVETLLQTTSRTAVRNSLLTAPVRGTILIVLVLAMFIADLFELEARNVEARNDMEIEAPKSSIAASLVVLIWSSYYALFFLVEGIWNQFVVA